MGIRAMVAICVVSAALMASSLSSPASASQGPGGTCGPGNWATINGVKWGCKQVSGKWTWVVVGKDPSYRPPGDSQQAGSKQAGSQQQRKPGKVKGPVSEQALLRTLQQGEGNSAFQIGRFFGPQIAQSIELTAPGFVSSVVLQPQEYQVATANYWAAVNRKAVGGGEASSDPSAHSEYSPGFVIGYNQKGSPPVGAQVTMSVWRPPAAAVPAGGLDLADGYELIARATTSAPLRIKEAYRIDLASPVLLDAGAYLLTFDVDTTDRGTLLVRFAGRESGSATDYNGQYQTDCDYKPSKDTYPAGMAYLGVGSGSQGPLPWGPDSGPGLGTRFIPHEAKVIACGGIGTFNTPTNQGDLDLTVNGWPATPAPPDQQWSKKAWLPPAAYAGLACDPSQGSAATVALPNGAGPEARAAAACIMQLWQAGASRPKPQFSIHASPGYPAAYTKLIPEAVAGGDRLFGAFAKQAPTYEFLLSTDAAWSCQAGKALVDTRPNTAAATPVAWAQLSNNGCPGSAYVPGAGQPITLGPNGSVYFTWTLWDTKDMPIEPDPDDPDDAAGHTRFFSHEFVHHVQLERAGYPNGPMRMPGGWYAEGMAQYLSYWAGSLAIGPKDIRAYALSNLAREARKSGITRVDMSTVDTDPNGELKYATGFFAYEYLAAHYGIPATFAWLTQWNSPACSTSQCWRDTANEVFGISADELNRRLSAYVTAQLAQARSMP